MIVKWRIGELEQRTGTGKQVVIMVRYDGDDTEPTEAPEKPAKVLRRQVFSTAPSSWGPVSLQRPWDPRACPHY